MATEKAFEKSLHPCRITAAEEPRKTEDISQHNKSNLHEVHYPRHIECRETESIST